MRSWIRRIIKRKLLVGSIAFIIGAGAYVGYQRVWGNGSQIRYVTAEASKGTLIVSLTGTGQVSVSSQIELKPKVSGEVASIAVAEGDSVRSGALLIQLDTRDADKLVRDAQANVEGAAIALAKMRQPADTLSLIQAKNALVQAAESEKQSQDNLAKSYEDAFTAIANAFLDMPPVMTGLQDILYSSTIAGSSGGQTNMNYYADTVRNYDARSSQYRDDTDAKYQKARQTYDQNFQDYKSANRLSGTAVVSALLAQTYQTAKNVSEAVKSSSNLIQFYEDRLTERTLKPLAIADTHIAALNSYTAKINADLANLLAATQAVQNTTDAIASARRAIAEKTESLKKLQQGPDPLDIQSSELTLRQRQNALQDAKEKLADSFIRAPFDGIVAKIYVKKRDSASSAAAALTLITRQQLAEIPLNEVDAAKVKIGQKATCTFDAVPELSVTGTVASLDTIGTTAQGVVTYTITIAFDTQDTRIKPGMSVSASIITDVAQDVLMVPSSAVKTNAGGAYVEVFGGVEPQPRSVETGLANDTMIEITSGLAPGDAVVTQTIKETAAVQSSGTSGSNVRIPGLGGGGIRQGAGGR